MSSTQIAAGYTAMFCF